VRFDPADRAFLAAVLQRVPGAVLRRVRLLVRPDTVLRWPSRGGALAVRLHAQHRQVHDLLDGDGSLKRISRQLGLVRGTVRRLARAGTVEELLAGRRLPAGPRLLDPYEEHLRRRWADGVTNAAPCSPRSAPWVTAAATAPCSSTSGPWRTGQPPTAPSARPLTRGRLGACDQTRRTAVRDACPQLNRLADHVSRFAVMVTGLGMLHRCFDVTGGSARPLIRGYKPTRRPG
jgi:hypothetical protein